MNHMSKSTGTDVMFIRNQWIEIATICMLEWSGQLHNAFRFDCAICSVIASHDGFTKKKNFSMDDVLYHYGTVIAHSMNG